MNQTKTVRSLSEEFELWLAIKELYAHRKLNRPSWVYARLDLGYVNHRLPAAHLEAYKKWKAHPNEENFFMLNWCEPTDP